MCSVGQKSNFPRAYLTTVRELNDLAHDWNGVSRTTHRIFRKFFDYEEDAQVIVSISTRIKEALDAFQVIFKSHRYSMTHRLFSPQLGATIAQEILAGNTNRLVGDIEHGVTQVTQDVAPARAEVEAVQSGILQIVEEVDFVQEGVSRFHTGVSRVERQLQVRGFCD